MAQRLAEVYGRIEAVSFDYGVMERTRERVAYVIPSECGWSDVGSWASLFELRAAELDDTKNLRDGDALMLDCQGSYVSAEGGRLVACLGLRDCLVVDTPDSLLVARRDQAQNIRRVVEALKEETKRRAAMKAHIFREYDIRGVYPEELNAETAQEREPRSGLSSRPRRPADHAGRDCRLSSPELADGLAQGWSPAGSTWSIWG